MSSARDIRAMVASIEKTMQQLRSARGADRDVDARKKAYADLEEDLADAAGALRMSKRSGVDSTRLSEKIIAAKALLTKFNPLSGSTVVDIEGSVVGGMSDLATRFPPREYSEPILTRATRRRRTKREKFHCIS